MNICYNNSINSSILFCYFSYSILFSCLFLRIIGFCVSFFLFFSISKRIHLRNKNTKSFSHYFHFEQSIFLFSLLFTISLVFFPILKSFSHCQLNRSKKCDRKYLSLSYKQNKIVFYLKVVAAECGECHIRCQLEW